MALYRYVKAPPQAVESTHPVVVFPFKRSARLPLTSSFLMLSGLVLMAWVAWPILSFEFFVSPRFSHMIKPIPDQIIAQALENTKANVLGSSTSQQSILPALVQGSGFDSTTIDYTKASNWFPKVPQKPTVGIKTNSYTISIPRLHIKDAVVIINGDDLNKSLIHYGGTSLPGEYGNGVIFGHSTLPALYDPKNYTTIFSLLPTLKERDEFFVTYDGLTYRYTIEDMRVVAADDVSVLSQKYDYSYITLVTCVPPGTYWKRLVIKARLAPL